jgi:putative ABC transport system permease protein
MVALKPQLRQVLRRLGRTPKFTGIALVTLAIGIGANTAIFSVVEGVLLKPLPYPGADRLVDVDHAAPGFNFKHAGMAPALYFVYRDQSRTFDDIGLYTGDSVNVTGSGPPEHLAAEDVTDGVLPILGIPPLLGRWFTRADDQPASADTVVLTYGYWQRKFGGDRSAIGKTLDIDGKPRQIIGMLPQRFQFLDETNLAMLLPMKLNRAKTYFGNFSYGGIARLKPGVTLAEANADVARMIPIAFRSFPVPPGFSLDLFKQARLSPDVRPLKRVVVGDVSQILWVLMGGIGMVLLIACANVANLLLVRVEGRRQELAIRAALGASPGRIASDLLLESFVLSFIGGALGLAFAYGALRVLIVIAPGGLPRLNQIGIDGPVLMFTLGVAVVSSLLFGSIPVLKYAGVRVGTGLREAGRSLSASRERHRARNTLVIVQVALAFVLLISAGLTIRTFRALIHVQPGFTAPASVQTFRLYIPEGAVKAPEQVARIEQEILEKVEALPEVSSVGVGHAVPMDGNGWHDPIFVKDRTPQGQLPPLRSFFFVSPGFFRTIGTPLVAGRDVTWDDITNKRPVAIVSENLARDYWQNAADALGKQIRISTTGEWRQIIGVVGNVYNDGIGKRAPTMVYWPLMNAHFEGNPVQVVRYPAFAIRSSLAGSQSIMKEIRRAVWSVDPDLPLADVHTLQYFYTKSLAPFSFTLVMLALAGGMALLLGIIGLYGVIAYSVSQRTREIGIRAALGAQQSQLVGMFVSHGLRLAAIGVACGLAVAFVAMRLMSSLLFGVRPADPLTYAAVSLGLIATAALASYLPARGAAAVNPSEALRIE